MGQQQLLLIILGVIVVGIAVAVGITMFSDSAVSANRDAITNDLVNLASRAQQYYRRPAMLGGGSNSFVGLTADILGLQKLTNKATNGNGTYSISVAGAGVGTASTVTLLGVGNEIGSDGTSKVTVKCVVLKDSVLCTVLF
jgi:Tfp pilus assembly protein PilE